MNENRAMQSNIAWRETEEKTEKAGKQGYLKKKRKKKNSAVSKGYTLLCLDRELIVPFSLIDRPLLKGKGIFSRVNDTPRGV